MSATPHRVAEVIRCCWESYNRQERLVPHVLKAVRHLLLCRTAALGGRLHACDRCGAQVPLYNSCRTRHCPSCQTAATREWHEARAREVLPVQYFHLVFTWPHALNALVNANRSLLLGELFGIVNWVLQRFARDPQWRLEGQLGFLAILHTWTQRLKLHFHLHCIVPGGVWKAETKQWTSCRGQWLFRKDSLADAFRNRTLKRLNTLRARGQLVYAGRAEPLAEERHWAALIDHLASRSWVVYPKAVPADARKALDYAARYTHKVAIGDHRIKALSEGQVTYSWRDRADGNREKHETIPALEFTRRFLAHILPDGFHKIRYFGWMAALNRSAMLADIRAALGAEAPPAPAKEELSVRILRETGVDITLCPCCKKGHLQATERIILPARGPP